MALTRSVALAALILCSMTVYVLAARPVVHNKATQGTLEHQAVPQSTSQVKPHHDASLLLQRGIPARQLLASTPTFDRDLEDRSKHVVNPRLEAAYKRFEANAAGASADDGSIPFRRLLASTPTFDRDLEDRSQHIVNPILEAAYKRFEAAAAGASADDGSIPFRRLLGKPGRYFTEKAQKEHSPMAARSTNPTLEAAYRRFEAIHAAGAKVAGDGTPFRRPLASIRYRAAAEDRSEFTTSGVLENAYKSLEAAATLGTKANTDSLSFRLLLSRDHSSDRKLEDRSAAATNPTLTAVKRLEAAAATDSLPFRRLLSRDHASDREAEDHSAAAVTNPTLTTAVKRFESDAAPDSLPFRRLLSRDHASDREAEDRSAAVTNPLLLSAYKRLEADQAGSGSDDPPFRRLLAQQAAAAAAVGTTQGQAAA